MEQLEVIAFDTQLYGEPEELVKASDCLKYTAKGRGGTSFQPIFDYIGEHQEYDGLLIFTDGGAPEPLVTFRNRTKVLWVCTQEEYMQGWMRKTGRSCYIKER